MIAHVGGLPLEESLVGLAPALAAVGLMIQRVLRIRIPGRALGALARFGRGGRDHRTKSIDVIGIDGSPD